MTDIVIPKNIREVMIKNREAIGSFKSEYFDYVTYQDIEELSIKSPIEQVMYSNLCTVRDLCNIEHSELGFFPQHRVGKYAADFIVKYDEVSRNRVVNEILVECDSQEWHERTEVQRRYEKERDRFFIKQGYRVFHYTGAEIIKNGHNIACEIISHVTGNDDVINCGLNYGLGE